MYSEPTAAADPYSDSYNLAPVPEAEPIKLEQETVPPPSNAAQRGRTRSRSPAPRSEIPVSSYRSPYRRRSPPPARRPNTAPVAPNPTNVLGVFGLSIRTQERDLDEEFSRFGRVEKVTIVYDQRQQDRSRGFGFIKMATVEDATRCIAELNGIDLNGRRIRVDYSVTDRPHAPTPGEYMGHRRASPTRSSGGYNRSRGSREPPSYRDSYRRGGSSSYYDRDSASSSHRGGGDRDRDRDPYGRDSRDWRDRRSPAPRGGGGGRYSPEPSHRRSRRSYSRSPNPPRGSPPRRDYDAPPRDYDAPSQSSNNRDYNDTNSTAAFNSRASLPPPVDYDAPPTQPYTNTAPIYSDAPPPQAAQDSAPPRW